VFAVAAIAKLADMPGSQKALEDFGVAPRFVRPGAIALPVAELISALLLIPASTAPVGAAFALALLGTFAGAIWGAMRRGQAPDCHCFGQIHSRPAGRETLIRNGVLGVVALFVLIGGGPSYADWASNSSGDRVAVAGLSLLVVVLAYACFTLWQEARNGSAGYTPPSVIQPGEPVADVALKTTQGEPVRLPDLIATETPTVLVFTSATCGPCEALVPELARWQQTLDGRLAIQVIASGEEATNQRISEEQGLRLLLDEQASALSAHGVAGTPGAVEVGPDGRVRTPPVAGAPAVQALIRASLTRPDARALELHQVNAES
jgi:peroxiredoxin